MATTTLETTGAAIHIPPGGGDVVWLVGDTYTTKLSGDQTGGTFSLSEGIVPPGGGPPPHAHMAEDETFILLDGELTFALGGEDQRASSGSVVFIPKGSVHSYQNIGDTPARILFLYSPAGMEQMFAEIGTPALPGAPAPAPGAEDIAKLLSVATKYRFTMGSGS